MKKNDFQKLKNRSADELLKEVQVERDKLWVIERDVRDGKVKNVHAPRLLKRDIARMLTLTKSKKAEVKDQK